MGDYLDFLRSKVVTAPVSGFEVADEDLSPALKPHQRDAVRWALNGGRRALFESFGLGKTVQELEFCRQVVRHEGGQALLVLPLGVRQEFVRDAQDLLHMDPPVYVRTMAEVKACSAPLVMTNYERVRDGDIAPQYFCCTSLDEASVLREFGSKTYQTFLEKFSGVKYKLVSTATPSPNRSKAYADDPVRKSKEDYTRAQWQLDAHGYWRSSGDRLVSKEELETIPVSNLQKAYREHSRGTVYDYAEHVALAKKLDEEGRLPATFMVVAPGSWNMDVWDDINRMRTLNTEQSRRRKQMHVCPLQLDTVERLINRYTNPGDLVYDPFGGIGTVPLVTIRMGRKGCMTELNPDYYRDAVGYLTAEDDTSMDNISLFDVV